MPRTMVWPVILTTAASVAAQPVARLEVIPFATMTLTTQQFLGGDAVGKPAEIAGTLRIPRPGGDRLAAVVLIHGAGGIGANVERWAEELNSAGYAVLLVDSFSGRGITNTMDDLDRLSQVGVIVDAYRALSLLAAHPRIDGRRVAIMGFSGGAVAAVYSALERFRRMHGVGDLAFAAHIGLYMPCSTSYIDDTKVGKAPIRLFHGTADNWAAIGPCQRYVERLQKAGADAALTAFAGAGHGYDFFQLAQPVKFAAGMTTRHCRLEERAAGEIVNVETGSRFDYRKDPCVEKGTQIAHDPAAYAATVRAVKDLLGNIVAH